MKRTRTVFDQPAVRHWLGLGIGFLFILLMTQLASAQPQDGPPPHSPARSPRHADQAPPPPRGPMDDMAGMRGEDDEGMVRGKRSHDEPTREELLEVLQAVKPEVAERFEQFSESRGNRGDGPPREQNKEGRPEKQGDRQDGRYFGRMMPYLRSLAMEKKRDPELYALRISDMKLKRETHVLAQALREARESKQDKDVIESLEDQIEEKVTVHFDVRQELQELDLKRLEERIELLSEQLEEREDARDDLIKQRVEELTQRKRGASW